MIETGMITDEIQETINSLEISYCDDKVLKDYSVCIEKMELLPFQEYGGAILFKELEDSLELCIGNGYGYKSELNNLYELFKKIRDEYLPGHRKYICNEILNLEAELDINQNNIIYDIFYYMCMFSAVIAPLLYYSFYVYTDLFMLLMIFWVFPLFVVSLVTSKKRSDYLNIKVEIKVLKDYCDCYC
jgi:hypothetical protein